MFAVYKQNHMHKAGRNSTNQRAGKNIIISSPVDGAAVNLQEVNANGERRVIANQLL